MVCVVYTVNEPNDRYASHTKRNVFVFRFVQRKEKHAVHCCIGQTESHMLVDYGSRHTSWDNGYPIEPRKRLKRRPQHIYTHLHTLSEAEFCHSMETHATNQYDIHKSICIIPIDNLLLACNIYNIEVKRKTRTQNIAPKSIIFAVCTHSVW